MRHGNGRSSRRSSQSPHHTSRNNRNNHGNRDNGGRHNRHRRDQPPLCHCKRGPAIHRYGSQMVCVDCYRMLTRDWRIVRKPVPTSTPPATDMRNRSKGFSSHPPDDAKWAPVVAGIVVAIFFLVVVFVVGAGFAACYLR